ncbi:MAG: helix-turn-helix domain-containing protein, partial [Thermodesulfobacteriota bacterium]
HGTHVAGIVAANGGSKGVAPGAKLIIIKAANSKKGKPMKEKLAEEMDISPNYLSSIERGKENQTFDMLVKFSDALEVEMWELFDFGHEVSPSELRELLNSFATEIDEEKLRLAVKVLRAMIR